MIVVLGRPALDVSVPVDAPRLGGRAARIAALVAGQGARVELVGSVGDDPEGDIAVIELGRAGVGHAAVLRDPTARTPIEGSVDPSPQERPRPRLDRADVELGLRYLPECRVLVVAEPLAAGAAQAAVEAADYHGASLVVVTASGPEAVPGGGVAWPESATLLEAPEEARASAVDGPPARTGEPTDDEPGDTQAFDGLVARFCLHLEAGEAPGPAFEAALRGAAWERATDA